MSEKPASLQSIHDELVLHAADLKWLKRGFWFLLAAIAATHFTDPTVHLGVFQFP